PRISSSSARAKSSDARASLTRDRLSQLFHLFRHALQLGADAHIAVLLAVAAIGNATHRLRVWYGMKVLALHDPTLGALAVTEMRLAGEDERHLEVLRLDRARVNKGIVVRS